ncbi:ABC transporter ATP-binding protein [Kocuria tytonis]|uniref:ABC transporter ATP-binding protein n=1 Tax=Kocuria tytonis TaxID=2054280 RepID=A0A495AB18_9MICC|nr:ABC transporter ATP-binding protein [Kocuria tytonis]
METVHAVNELDVSFAEGEFVGLLGASGSGKTTFVNVLAGLENATAGAVTVAGHDLRALGAAERARLRREDIGVVFQDNNLVQEFTARENVALPLIMGGVRRRDAHAEADDMLDVLGLEGLGGRAPRQLSGGQQQRVGIARALVGGRRVLLADEPTGALDTQNSRAIFGLFAELASTGVTVVVATHDSLIEEYADRILVLRDGRLVEDRPAHGAPVSGR